jgi:hypothetical protein
VKQSPFQGLESLLLAWFEEARVISVVISGTLLREKASHMATRLGIEDFKASDFWIDWFQVAKQCCVQNYIGRMHK